MMLSCEFGWMEGFIELEVKNDDDDKLMMEMKIEEWNRF